jgi:hypothetical protein
VSCSATATESKMTNPSDRDTLQFINELISDFLLQGRTETATFLAEEVIPMITVYDC